MNSGNVLAQACAATDYYWTSQAEIDNFVATYGGSGCSQIDGDLTIRGYSGITDLSGLSFITEVTGSMAIDLNSALPSLTGLQNITSVGGLLSIQSNGSLTNLTGLDNLQTVGNDFRIFSQKHVRNINIWKLENIVTEST